MPRLSTLGLGSLSLLSVGWLGWKAAHWLPLPSGAVYVWLVRVVVWLIGLLITFLVFRLVRRRGPKEPPPEPDAVQLLLDRAEERLKAAGKGGRTLLRRLPVVLVLGPRGAAKTTLVQRSDLGTEHIAGDGAPAAIPRPTEAVNVWYHEDHVLVEAGGSVVSDPERWEGLVERLQPRKWIPALLGRPQAPRVAVVCYPVDGLRNGEPAAAAAELRSRLTKMSESIGIRLPIYVVFTKVDTVPHFEAFVEDLTEGETHELLGATLRAQTDLSAGSYRDREAARLRTAFDELFLSLSERRVDLLSRSGSTDGNGEAYEFPREFRKITGRATDFLVELCRPSQLQVSPFLRGFYFTGVRPVVVTEASDVPSLAPSSVPVSAEGATNVFDARRMREEAARTAPPNGERRRRMPQWVFLERILPRVVLADRVAMGITTGGFGLTVLRRTALAAGIAVCLAVGVAALLGFGAERDLQAETAAALEGVQGLRSPDPALASVDDLHRLEALRSVAARLSRYENHDRPARALLGLYTGGSFHAGVRGAYFDRFRPVLLDRATYGVMATLDDLPAEPSLDAYDRVYDALKLYVEMSDHPEEADSVFFGRELTMHWTGASDPAEEQRELARAQFAFYGGELPHGNPYERVADNRRVASARDFLVRNTDLASFYRSLLAQWDQLPDVDFNRDHPGTARFVRNPRVVRGAFTRMGWDSIQTSFSSTDRAFNLDRHVVGDQFFVTLAERGFDPEVLAPELQRRYEGDYVQTWLDFLNEADVGQPALNSADEWLAAMGGGESALFVMIDVVDEHTRTDAATLDTIFRPVRMLAGPDSLSVLFSEAWGAPYLSNVRALGQAAGFWVGNTSDPGATNDFGQAAAAGRGFVQDLAVEFPREPAEARVVGDAVARLLSEPFDWAVGVAARGEAMAANQLAQAFCSDQSRVLSAYPFRRNAPDADLGDVHALFQPDEGELYAFMQEAEATGSDLGSRYESFVRQAERISRSFYERGPGSPTFRIQFRILQFSGSERVQLNVDGRRGVFTPTQQEAETFEWVGERAEEVTLVVDTPDGPVGREYHGTWALFEFFHQANWRSLGSRRYEVTWPLEGGLRLVGEVRLTGEPLLDPGYLSSLSCPRTIAE